MKISSKASFDVIVVLASTVLMQWHSIELWKAQVGLIGIAWSLSIEVALISFIWNRNLSMAFFTAILLISGPAIQITKPTVEGVLGQIDSQEAKQRSLDRIERLQASLDTYNQNSENRTGWYPMIQRTQALIDSEISEISEIDRKYSLSTNFRNWTISGIQIAALLLLMIAQANAVSRLKRISETPKPSGNNDLEGTERDLTKPEISEISEISETLAISGIWNKRPKTPITPETIASAPVFSRAVNPDRYGMIPSALDAALSESGETQKQWCDRHGVNPQHLSLAKNHNERMANKHKTAPKQALEQIACILKRHMEQETIEWSESNA